MSAKKKFLFNMSIGGDGSGCDFVKRMQPRGNLETCWMDGPDLPHV